MNRAEIIGRYRHAATLARREGVPVHFYDRWTSRGRPGLEPRAIVNHDTSDNGIVAASTLLRILANGHGAIAGNAICTDAILLNGDVWIIASGLAWHAGRSTWNGLDGLNDDALGTEYQRSVRGSLTEIQLYNGRIWDRARMAAFAIPPSMVAEHGEVGLPRGRKVDRQLRPGIRLHGADWRRQIARPITPPTPPEDIMASLDDLKKLLDPITDRIANLGRQLSDHHQTANRGVRLGRAASTAAVARLRTDVLGMDPSPESDAKQVEYLERGLRGTTPYTWADVERRLREAAAAGEPSSPPTDPAGDVDE